MNWYNVVSRGRETVRHAEEPMHEDTRVLHTMCGLEMRPREWKAVPDAVTCDKCWEAVTRYNTESVGKVGLSTRRGADGWMRPTLVLSGDGASVDLIGKDGKLICRLNLATNEDGWANVDVILTDGGRRTHKLTAISWHEGRQVFRNETPSGLVAVDISKVGQ